MKDLNLSKDINTFDWHEDFIREASLKALEEKQMTYSFSTMVWNDIVNLVNQVVIAVGLEWDNIQGGFNYCHLSVFEPFMAKKFNGVVYNIKRLANALFRWEYDETYKGFLNRTYVKGLSTSAEPDILYGDYILEIVRKLNYTIMLLKGELNTCDAKAKLNIQQISTSILSSAIIFELRINEAFKVLKENVSLSILRPFVMNGRIPNFDNIYSKLEKKKGSESFNANSLLQLKYSVVITLEKLYSYLECELKANMRFDAKLKYVEPMDFKVVLGHSISSIGALIFPTLVLMLGNAKALKESIIGNLTKNNPLILAINYLEDATLFDAKLNQRYRLLANANIMAGAIKGYGTILNSMKSDVIGLVSMRLGIQNSNMKKLVVKRISLRINCRTTPNNFSMASKEAIVTSSLEEIESTILGTAYAREGIPSEMVANNRAILNLNLMPREALYLENLNKFDVVHEKVSLILKQLVYGVGVATNKMKSSITLQKELPFIMEGNYIDDSFKHNAILTNYNFKESLQASAIINSLNTSIISFVNFGIYPKINDLFRSISDAVLTNVEPYLLEIRHKEILKHKETFYLFESKNSIFINYLAFFHSVECVFDRLISATLSVFTFAKMRYSSEISFSPLSWLNPVKTYDEIYIGQAYENHSNDGILEIK